MTNYNEIAQKATITLEENPPAVQASDSVEIKELKKLPLWMFDFTNVPETDVTTMGEYGATKEEALAKVAERLKDF